MVFYVIEIEGVFNFYCVQDFRVLSAVMFDTVDSASRCLRSEARQQVSVETADFTCHHAQSVSHNSESCARRFLY